MKKFNDFLLEQYTDEGFVFSTIIKADLSSIRNWDKTKKDLEENDNFDDNSDFQISWKLNFDVREYGVKNIDVEILDIKGNILVNMWGEDQDNEKEYEFDNKIENFKIVTELDNIKTTISIVDMEIDFLTKTITINF
jgi:hypothetical protein